MIEVQSIPDGVMLKTKPFGKLNKNADCTILARVTSSQGTRRDARLFVGNLNNMMTISDVRILTTALRAVIDEVEKQMGEVQEKAAKKVARKIARKKAAGKK